MAVPFIPREISLIKKKASPILTSMMYTLANRDAKGLLWRIIHNTIQYNTVIYIAPFQVTLLKALFSSRTN
jgi:hypothetical protein